MKRTYPSPGTTLLILRHAARWLYAMQGTGLPRLAEFIRRFVARILRDKGDDAEIWIDDFCGNLRFRCDLSEHMGSQIFFRGEYSGAQLGVLKRLLSSDSIFVDVGANQGEFTVCAAALVPHGAVHAFEPVSAMRQRLQINIEANGFDNIQVHDVGLSDKNLDDVPIYGASDQFADGTLHAGLPTLYHLDHRGCELERVRLRPLDVCLPTTQTHVDMIKIDVEGAELFVLRGGENVIRTSRPYIIFEANEQTSRAAGYSVEDICDWLRQRNYQLVLINSNGKLAQLGEQHSFGNIVAVPSGKSKLVALL